MKDKSIELLLVEDDDVDVMNVQRAFKKNNIINKLHVAGNGLEALALLRGEGVESIRPKTKLILLDINMPKMNGIEFLNELRKDPDLNPLTVFVLTTSNQDRDKFDAYSLNVAGYILKPVELSVFMSAVATLDMYWSLIEMP